MDSKKRPVPFSVVIAGGGTGGHLYPGIAVARELLSRQPAATVSFAGTANGIEARVVPHEGFALDLIRSGGLKGKSIVDRARGAMLIPLGLIDAWRIVSTRRPDLVVGVGGYSSGPVVLVAALRGVPTMLLEQNAVPGLTNRWLSPYIQAAAVSFESAKACFGSKAFVSGNPVRPEFFDAAGSKESSRNAETTKVLVVGGSQGAHAINMAMAEAAAELAVRRPPLHITHQTGERDLEVVRSAYAQARLATDVRPFLHDMGRQLRQADVVVCRAGATTLAEITAAGKAAILIPLPTAADDHQRKNAEVLMSVGAADLLLQCDLTGTVLAQRIVALAGDRAGRERMAAAAAALSRPDAARVIVDRAMELMKR